MMDPLTSSSNGNHDNPKDADHVPSRILLMSCPRTASNLLTTMLSLPDQNVHTNRTGGYYFYDGYMSMVEDNRAYRPIEEWPAEEKGQVQAIFQKCFDSLEDYSTEAKKQGKMMFAKEHSYWITSPESFKELIYDTENAENGTRNGSPAINVQIPESYGTSQTFSSKNKTFLSDEYLRTWKVAFIIRHPALAFPSLYRAMLKTQDMGMLKPENFRSATDTNMSLRWTRMLFDWCEEQKAAATSEAEKRAREPVLLDANDVIHNPSTVARFCELTGLDASKLKFEWGNGNKEEPKASGNAESNGSATQTEEVKWDNASKAIMLSTLIASSGVVKEKAPETVDIAAEVAKWKEEFGKDGARAIEKAVLAAMADYEYLKARRCV